MSVTGFLKNGKIEKYDYNALANKPSGGGGTGLTEEAKQALLTCFQKVAYIDANGETYYQALYDALYAAPKVLTSINASYTQSGEVLTTDSLDSLRKDIVVTAYYSDSTSATVTDYSLSGNLTAGTSIITVYYNGMTDTISVAVTAVAGTYTISNHLTGCTTSNSMTSIAEGGSYTATITASSGYTLTGATESVTMGGNIVTGAYSNGTISIANITGDIVITVTAAVRTVSSISAVFTQGDNVIYTTDTLDSLKQYLVVTATYSDDRAEAVSDYTLSGTLEEGTSTITVSYGGKADTFNVTVSADLYYYSIHNGQIVKIVGATSGAVPKHAGVIELDKTSSNRRSFPTLRTGVKPYSSKSEEYADTEYYPIPIPTDAIKAVVSIEPSTQYTGSSFYTYSPSDGYTRQLNPGWKLGSFTYSFTAGQYAYMTIASKYDSAGSSYPTEPTEVSLQFLTE